ncbi:MAG: tRNA uridine-5-carboxymethylaminomethyl(34) synthesis GTPase MnmE [Hydrogenobaculum sp.]|jgi:tRNA modification GTPase
MNNTIVAPATPVLKSAISILRLSGLNCIDVANRFLHIENPKPRYAYRTSFYINDKELDDVVAIYYKAPRSYTGEDMLEIFFHGNPIIVEKAIEALVDYGCSFASPGEFTKRAFLNGKMTLDEASSVELLINANTEKAVENALNMLKGRFSSFIEELRKEFIRIIANIEADIEFGYEDIEPLDVNEIKKEINNLICRLEEFHKKLKEQSYLYDGIKIAIVGKPNVGKSSLFNTLLQKRRAIVSDIPGTTRDYIEDRLEINGFPVKLVDTAGIRKTDDPIEKEGINIAIEHMKEAHVVLFMVDGSKELEEEDYFIYDIVKNLNTLVVLNKSDLGINSKTLDFFKDNAIIISIRNQENVEHLKNKVLHMLDLAEDGIYVSKRNKFLVAKALGSLKEAVLQDKTEVMMLYIREALDYLEEILGLITDENVLDEIFSTFCIGK